MKESREFTVVEILIVAAVVFSLLALALPRIKSSQTREQSGKRALADMRKIGAAKEQYAADHGCKPGDPVGMAQLVRGGYLSGTPHSLPPGSRFVVGRIGTPVTITSEPEHHDRSHGQE